MWTRNFRKAVWKQVVNKIHEKSQVKLVHPVGRALNFDWFFNC